MVRNSAGMVRMMIQPYPVYNPYTVGTHGGMMEFHAEMMNIHSGVLNNGGMNNINMQGGMININSVDFGKYIMVATIDDG